MKKKRYINPQSDKERRMQQQSGLGKSFFERQNMEAEARGSFSFYDSSKWLLTERFGKYTRKGLCKCFSVTLHEAIPRKEVIKRLQKVFP